MVFSSAKERPSLFTRAREGAFSYPYVQTSFDPSPITLLAWLRTLLSLQRYGGLHPGSP
jgi:hypothetical protein